MAFQIGTFSFDGAPWLAPLAAVSSAPFRQICLEHGCGQAVTEMVSCESLVRNIEKTAHRMTRASGERVLIVQLFGSNPQTMAKAAQIAVERGGADIVDINMGCPVRKVLGTGSGAALLRDPVLAALIVRSVADAVSPVPVTVKIRAGWDAEVNAVQIANAVVEAGAKCIAVHGRTKEQFHKGSASLDVIAAVKEAVNVPVIGNGGVRSVADARTMLAATNCDAVMIGRGSLGNPWIFSSIAGGIDDMPSLSERFNTIRQHLGLHVQYAGQLVAVREMRKQLGWYLKGLPASAMVREQLQMLHTENDMLDVLAKYEDLLVRGEAKPSVMDFSAGID
ncbi:MAG: tRNA dihydrouridine synthase DusB [Polyangiaceae bacterium]|nr:tRNA dihydrouridine synthase DusB [Polyangiaceae bacterium]